jgi:hypothetical protein
VNAALLGGLLLAVSLVSVVVYMSALGQLLVGEKRPGLVRTAICRLLAALLYVGVGLATLESGQQGPLVGLAVFTIVQLMWQANSIADVRLSRKTRSKEMPEDLTPDQPGVVEPTPNYATPLSDIVVSAEIDRLSEKMNSIQRRVEKRDEAEQGYLYWRRFGYGALGLTFVIATSALIFGLITFSRADRANELAQQNRTLITEMKATQAKIDAQQARQDVTVHEFCGLYESFLGFYNLKSRAMFLQGPDAYDEQYRRLLLSSERLKCGLKPPRGLDG